MAIASILHSANSISGYAVQKNFCAGVAGNPVSGSAPKGTDFGAPHGHQLIASGGAVISRRQAEGDIFDPGILRII